MPGQRRDDEASQLEGQPLGSQWSSKDNYYSVLNMPPGRPKSALSNYSNLTPWVRGLFFCHTYFAYVYTFYMFVLAFYKGYALQYPPGRQTWEMVLIMVLPAMQHLRFFFGHWGNELGRPHDLFAFMLFGTMTMLVLMYFLFYQAYIMPLDTSYLTIAVFIVAVEGICGIINSLQTMKLMSLSVCQISMLLISMTSLLGVITFFFLKELLPTEAWVEQYQIMKDAH
eukprot:CAMPEP_0197655276 /NCGR_PEP_ID=MMETSP1338-20131121/39361_1 /TAXON_ID=43686 ORGANISM="Pelagodinium beii, Strain RCC1491" /NCGR_SAMPLE_ID=MMETSP1338 /ASSEMBLY_ACC=CAM_ASM_000754 /LENGTH=225 /DNA_ID=CAMNT_0043230901 /DNA_START=74 /DNA_END=751 /DNA_ORIENTATION=+